ncbi:serine hydrolase domain-containing protein [Hyphomonas sp.]|uniref:serine hydrolase domain-containing protein n=1 Tax=Hyphomonas sp. TaxID=87 RepID=UPI0025C67AA9|nr:serine hydrolase domain-containing protein [Hyphomonas sp.]
MERLEGDWFGAIFPNGHRLPLRLAIANDSATLYSLGQGNSPISSTTLHHRGRWIRIEFGTLNATIEGDINNEWIVGEFRQGNTLPIGFSRSPIDPPSDLPLNLEHVDALRMRVGAPALAVASSHVDGRNLSLARGIRMLGHAAPVELNDKWHIGSIAKSMTAILVARLVDAGATRWDQTIGSVMGDQLGDIRTEYLSISIRQLLQHRSGLPKDLPARATRRFPAVEPDPRASRLEFVNLALNLEPVGAPGRSFSYSNCGYVIVGAMLERLCGEPWEQLVRQYVFAPLGMGSAGFGAPGGRGLIDQPVGHEDAGIDEAPLARPPGTRFADNAAVWGPAGTIHASLGDVLRYLGAHRDRDAFLSPDSWSVLLAPDDDRVVAMGWAKRGSGYWHSGSNALWYCEAMFDPVRGVACIAAANDGRIARVQSAVNAALVAGAGTLAL